jgi:hypothetical protein
LTAAIAGGALLVVALGAGAYTLLNGTDEGGGGDSLWAAYFYPARSGYECTYQAELDGLVPGTMTQTQRVTAVEESDEGTRITVHSTARSELDAGAPVPTDLPATPVESDIVYVIARDGTLQTPAAFVDTAAVGGGIDGSIVYPSIENIRSGQAFESTLSMSMDLGESAPAGADAIEFRVGIRAEGEAPETITTPAGTYTDVVGVTISFTAFDFVGDLPGLDESGFDADTFEEMLVGLMPEITSWYARDVGLVSTESTSSMAGMSTELTGCTG